MFWESRQQKSSFEVIIIPSPSISYQVTTTADRFCCGSALFSSILSPLCYHVFSVYFSTDMIPWEVFLVNAMQNHVRSVFDRWMLWLSPLCAMFVSTMVCNVPLCANLMLRVLSVLFLYWFFVSFLFYGLSSCFHRSSGSFSPAGKIIRGSSDKFSPDGKTIFWSFFTVCLRPQHPLVIVYSKFPTWQVRYRWVWPHLRQSEQFDDMHSCLVDDIPGPKVCTEGPPRWDGLAAAVTAHTGSANPPTK